jgi:AraC family transcriptional regulator
MTLCAEEPVTGLFKKLSRMWTMRQDGYYHRCLAIVYEIIAELCAQSYQPSEKSLLIAPAIQYIETHLTEEIDCHHLAALCKLSYSYTKRLFIQCYGLPPKRYITRLRLNIACEQLEAGQLSVGEIADMLGYANRHYFSRLFREEMGCPPSCWKAVDRQSMQ